MGIAYRPEIDGLRAIAVLAVVLHHAGLGGAGYVGVDVFFVISGYLITSLLLHEWQTTAAIDLLAFYARRVRRIFPAAAVVVLAVLCVSALLLPPGQQVETALSAGAALLFGANVFFQFTSGGYFDGRAEEMPLLHLWSLSVEEQFYFLWPALLVVVLRHRPQGIPSIIAGLAIASFLLAEVLLSAGTEAAFYQMPARFWELAAGGLIAALPARALPRYAAPAGILLVLAACLWPIGRFPGVGALPVVVGASLLIAAIHGGATNAFLRSKPMVGVGLISYSLYLWHWPLLAFYRATSIGEGSIQVRLQLCVVAVLLAIASYRYIEQPFRRMRWPKGRTVAIGGAISASLALAACGYGLQARRAPPDDNPIALKAGRDMPPRTCHATAMDPALPKCQPVAQTRVAIWGDSMAYSWTPLAWHIDEHAVAFTRDACGPFIGFMPAKVFPGDVKCRDFNAQVAERAASLDTMILVARWHAHFAMDGAEQGLGRTLEGLRDVRRVIILGPTPEMREDVPRCIRQHAEPRCAIARSDFDAAAKPIIEKLRRLAASHANVEVVDVTKHFCAATSCPPVKEGMPLYWDTHHVTVSAARSFAAPSRLADARYR